jgi:hypothetical protein
VCGRGQRTPPCAWCPRTEGAFQCDWKIGAGKTCSKHICGDHALEVAPNKHLCPEHQTAYEKWRATQAKQPPHCCHVPYCTKVVPRERLMCWWHWKMVPADLQKEVWRHYRKGQCDDMKPSSEYLAAARAAIDAVVTQIGPPIIARPKP